MARGRFISKTLGTSSRKFAALLNGSGNFPEFPCALYMLLIPSTDDFGRMDGDAWTIRHSIWPTNPRSVSDFETALLHMTRVGLIDRYWVGEQQVLQILGFDLHQVGLHKRTKSHFPDCPSLRDPRDVLPELPGISRNAPEVPVQVEVEEEVEEEVRTAPVRRRARATKQPAEKGDDPKPNGEIRQFSDAFLVLWAKAHDGGHYQWQGAKDTELVKKLLATYGLERLLVLAEGLMDTDDYWVAGTDRGVGILWKKASWLDGLCSKREAGQVAQLAVPHIPMGCYHEPPCATISNCNWKRVEESKAPCP